MLNRHVAFDDVYEYLELSYAKVFGKKFNAVQKAILEVAWNDVGYRNLAESTDYSHSYILNKTAPELYRKLGDVFGTKITKKNLRKVIEGMLRPSDLQIKNTHGKRVDSKLPNQIGKIPQPQCFVGRDAELQVLSEAVATNQCVILTGVSGIGKTSLASTFLRQQANSGQFRTLIWKYCISESPQLDIQDLMILLAKEGSYSTCIPDVLREQPLLICFDGIDLWLKTHRKETEELIQQFVETVHSSCILMTSSEPLTVVERIAKQGRPILNLGVKGLSTDAARSIMHFYDLDFDEIDTLCNTYQGNPQLLHLACEKIKTLFRGNIEFFLQSKTSFASDALREFLNNLFSFSGGQILEIDRFVLEQLVQATSESPVLFGDLLGKFQNSTSISILQIQKSVEKLSRFSLISLHNTPESVEIVVPKYVQKYVKGNPFELFSFSTLPA